MACNLEPPFYWGIGIENTWMGGDYTPGHPPKRLLDEFLQMQHYDHWKEDLDRAADLGVNTIRYSVPWYKANPNPGVYDWQWIDGLLDYLVNKLEVIPTIDLVHYGTPLWMDNAELNQAYPQRLAEFCAAFARRFKGLVNHYTPHNEPQLSALLCGYHGYWPPYLSGVEGWLKVGTNIARGMVLASQALRSELPDVTLISADCFASPSPQEVAEALAVEVSADAQGDFDYLTHTFPACLAYGKVAPGSPFGQILLKAGMIFADLEWFSADPQAPTILGVNFYPDCFRRSLDPADGLRQGSEELRHHLLQAHEFFNLPVYLSETSDGLTDEHKTAWMQAATTVIAVLRGAGVPVVGINWWPLYDAVMWDFRDSLKTVAEAILPGGWGWNNGLYKIAELPDGELKRVKTSAVDAYRNLIRLSSF